MRHSVHGWLHRPLDRPAAEAVPSLASAAAWWDGMPAEAPSVAPVIHAVRAAELVGPPSTAKAA